MTTGQAEICELEVSSLSFLARLECYAIAAMLNTDKASIGRAMC